LCHSMDGRLRCVHVGRRRQVVTVPGVDAAAAGRGIAVPSQLLATARQKCLSS
jgi:hypothetical protein